MGSGSGGGGVRGKDERLAVPAMPMPLAVIACILNFLVPGLGTIIAGFSSCCCSRNEDMGPAQRCGACCISFGIGLLQFVLTVVLLIGWIWSCIWGVAFIGMSAEYYHNNPPTDRDRYGPRTTQAVTTQPATTTVVSTGYPAQPQNQVQPQPQQQIPPQAYGVAPQGAVYPPQPGYGQPQPGYGAMPPQGYGHPPQQGYGPPPQQGYGPSSSQGYGHPAQGYTPELPPPYTEKDTPQSNPNPSQPSAPPPSKM